MSDTFVLTCLVFWWFGYSYVLHCAFVFCILFVCFGAGSCLCLLLLWFWCTGVVLFPAVLGVLTLVAVCVDGFDFSFVILLLLLFDYVCWFGFRLCVLLFLVYR